MGVLESLKKCHSHILNGKFDSFGTVRSERVNKKIRNCLPKNICLANFFHIIVKP